MEVVAPVAWLAYPSATKRPVDPGTHLSCLIPGLRFMRKRIRIPSKMSSGSSAMGSVRQRSRLGRQSFAMWHFRFRRLGVPRRLGLNWTPPIQ